MECIVALPLEQARLITATKEWDISARNDCFFLAKGAGSKSRNVYRESVSSRLMACIRRETEFEELDFAIRTAIFLPFFSGSVKFYFFSLCLGMKKSQCKPSVLISNFEFGFKSSRLRGDTFFIRAHLMYKSSSPVPFLILEYQQGTGQKFTGFNRKKIRMEIVSNVQAE